MNSTLFRSRSSALGPARSRTNAVYVGLENGGIHRTTNGGGSWSSGAGLPARFVTDIVVHPTIPGTAYATVSGFGTGHVYRTTNSGANWTNISGNLPNTPANAVQVDARTATPTIYVGTDVGGEMLGVDFGVTPSRAAQLCRPGASCPVRSTYSV